MPESKSWAFLITRSGKPNDLLESFTRGCLSELKVQVKVVGYGLVENLSRFTTTSTPSLYLRGWVICWRVGSPVLL